MSASCAALYRRGEASGCQWPDAGVRAPIERLLRVLVSMSAASAATLRTRSSTGDALQLVASCEIAPALQQRIERVAGNCGACCDALQDGGMHVAVQSCQCVEALAAHDGGPRRVVAVPLHNRGETSGVLSLFLKDDGSAPALSDTVLELLPALGDLLGLLLENELLSEADFRAGLMLQRQLIANEVHDSLAQNLASVRMRTALLRDAVAKRDAARTAEYLAEIDESLGLAQSRVREIITDFRSQMGATQLIPAIENAVEELRAASGIRIDFDSDAREPRLSAFEQVQVFYIAREALTNALKHARPRSVRVALAEVDGNIELRVEDDGVGLAPERARGAGHFGLEIMSERASRLGGTVAFEPGAAGGTRVRLLFPSRMVGAGSAA